LPRRLEKVFQEEPNYLDLRFAKTSEHLSLRQPKFIETVARLSATLQSRSLDEIIGQDIHQHRKTMRWLRFAVAGLVVLTIAAGYAAFVARQAWFMAGSGGYRGRGEQQQRKRCPAKWRRSLAVLETNRELAILLAWRRPVFHYRRSAERLRQSLFEALPPKLTLRVTRGTYLPSSRRMPDG
jgi:hypothetical protein